MSVGPGSRDDAGRQVGASESRPAADHDLIEHASWLSDRVLVLLLAATDAPSAGARTGRLLASRDGEPVELNARWLDCPADGGEAPRGGRVVTAALPDQDGDGLAGLELRDGARTARLRPGALQRVLRPSSQLATLCRRRFDPATCGRIASFIEATPKAHNLELGPADAAQLRAIRNELRRRDPLESVEIERAPIDEGLGVEAVVRVPERSPYLGTYSLALEGWVLVAERANVAVTLRDASGVIRSTAANLPSRDLAARHPDVPGATAARFQFAIGTIGLPPEFELDVEAVIDDQHRIPLGRVRVRRARLRTKHSAPLQPLLMSTLGRSGSNLLLGLLSRHPEIVAYRAFRSETRATGYWMGVLQALSEPASHMQLLFAQVYEGQWWLGDRRPGPLPFELAESELPLWLGSDNVEAIAEMCQSRIDAFYQRVLDVEDRHGARYFAEKAFPGPTAAMIRELYPASQEIVLVRDFRDVACSILDYNAKRGLELWGRGRSESDAEWIEYLWIRAVKLLDRWHTGAKLVRYEDLVLDAEGTLADLFEHLSIDAGDETVRAVVEEAGRLAPNAQASHATSATPEISISRWKRELSPELRALFATEFDEILTQFGYEATSDG